MPKPGSTWVPLKDGDYAPDYETLQKTYWLLCRHTSVTYISRMVEMLEAFTKGFEAYVGKFTFQPGNFPDFLRVCYSDIVDHKEGLSRLRRGDTSGFKLIRGGMSFRFPFFQRVTDWDFDDIGYKGSSSPGVALWSWIERVIPMSMNIERVLWGHLSYPLFDISQFKCPAQIGGYPLGENMFIKDGDDIPVTGVWHPKSLKGGCPNFFIQGEKAPKASLPVLRTDTPAWDEKLPNNWGIVHHEAYSHFDLKEFPTVWQLMWEDNRWRDGREPLGEYEYVEGPDTELPKDPPVALRDPPKTPFE